MKLAGLLPDADLLSRVEGVEAGLRRLRRVGRSGQVGFLVVAAVQVVTRAVDAGAIELDPRAAQVLGLAEAVSLVGLPLFLSLVAVSRYWLHQARQPFRYTCSIEDFQVAPQSPAVAKMAWLRYDLERLLNERVKRLTFRDSDEDAGAAGGGAGARDTNAGARDPSDENGDPTGDRAHFHVVGVYVVREDRIEVMPSVRIGSRASARTLAHPVSHTLDGQDLQPQQYRELLERLYFSVATEMYRQIEDDVARKISLLRTRYLQARGLFHEAEDYARSNTLAAYEQAARLYDAAARRLDPALTPLPPARLRRQAARLRRAGAAWWRRGRRVLASVHPRSAQRDVLWARCRVGYADMLLSRRLMSLLSGQRINAVFEALHVARDAFARLHDELPDGVPDRDEALFDTHVTLALLLNDLHDWTGACEQLTAARARDPVGAELDPRYLLALGESEENARSRVKLLRRAAELDQRFEASHWTLAYELEMDWRQWGDLEVTKADVVLDAYWDVLRLNPSNIGAWANTGYICWLLGRRGQAADALRSGRATRAVKAETFVAELDHGLARIAAEDGRFEDAYRHATEATAALVANGVAHAPGGYAAYYFSHVSEAVTARFRSYEQAVADHLAEARERGQLSPRILDIVEAFVATDVGECLARNSDAAAAGRRIAEAETLRREAGERLERAISLDPESVLPHYLRRNMLHGSTDPESRERCRSHVSAIQRLEPGWPDGVLLAVEAEGERAAIARNSAAEAEREIARKRARISQLRRETSDSNPWQQFSPETVPAMSGSQQDKLQELRRSEADLAKVRRKHENALREADDAMKKATAAIRTLVPHAWLWDPGGGFDWSALVGTDPEQERWWERQFEEIHVRALYRYGCVLLRTGEAGGQPGPVRAAALLERLADAFWPRDPEVLHALLVARAASGPVDGVEEVFRRLDGTAARVVMALLKPAYDDHPEWQAAVVAAACRHEQLDVATSVWFAERAVGLRRELPEGAAARRDLDDAAFRAACRGLEAMDAETVFAAATALERLERLDSVEAYRKVLTLDAAAGKPASDAEAAGRSGRELASRAAIAARLLLDDEPDLAHEQIEKLLAHGRPLAEAADAVAKRLMAAGAEEDPDRLRAKGRELRRWLRGLGPDPADDGSWREAQLAALAVAAREPPPGRRVAARQWLLPLVTPVAVELAPDLLETPDAEAQLQNLAPAVRDGVQRDWGVRTPLVRIRRNEDLPAGTYALLLDESPLSSGRLVPDAVTVPGNGHGGADLQADVAQLLRAFVEEHLADFLGIQEVANTLDDWRYEGGRRRPGRAALLSRATALDPDHALLTRVLRELVAEGVPIVRLSAILRSFVETAGAADRTTLIERIRTVVGGSPPAVGPDRFRIPLPPELDRAVRDHVTLRDGEPTLAFPNDDLDGVLEALRALLDVPGDPVLVAAADIRPLVRRLLDRVFPAVPVLADGELRLDPVETALAGTDHEPAPVADGAPPPTAGVRPVAESHP